MAEFGTWPNSIRLRVRNLSRYEDEKVYLSFKEAQAHLFVVVFVPLSLGVKMKIEKK